MHSLLARMAIAMGGFIFLEPQRKAVATVHAVAIPPSPPPAIARRVYWPPPFRHELQRVGHLIPPPQAADNADNLARI
jgi:hypothetical protein